jgi:hypothetical protein
MTTVVTESKTLRELNLRISLAKIGSVLLCLNGRARAY